MKLQESLYGRSRIQFGYKLPRSKNRIKYFNIGDKFISNGTEIIVLECKEIEDRLEVKLVCRNENISEIKKDIEGLLCN